MKCIFCLLDKSATEFTSEHVFPEAIGGSFELENCVCRSCNSFLGSNVDVYLTDHYIIQMHRLLHRLPGKSGKIPNPFERGTLTGDNPQKIKYYFDDDGNPKELYLTPSIVKAKMPNDATKVSISIDIKDKDKLPDMLNKIILRSGSKNEITADDIKQLKIEKIEKPRICVNAKIDIVNYQKAILKIVYELAYYWLGVSYIDDPSAQLIRNAILDQSDPATWGEKYKIRGHIGLFKESPIIPFGSDLATSHIALLSRSSNDIACYVRIFTVFEGIIAVTEKAQLYHNFRDKFLEIESLTGNKRESDLIEGLVYLTKPRN